MNLKQLIKFGIEESSVPVIKNPILRAALEPRSAVQEPRNMAHGGRIGFRYGSSSFDAHTKREAAFKAYKDYKKSYYNSRQRNPIITFREFLPIYAKENFAEGGRIIGKPGGLVEPGVEYYAKKIELTSTHKNNILAWGKNKGDGEWSNERIFEEYEKSGGNRRSDIREGIQTGTKRNITKLTTKEVQALYKDLPDNISIQVIKRGKKKIPEYTFRAKVSGKNVGKEKWTMDLKATPENKTKIIEETQKVLDEYHPNRLSREEYAELRLKPENKRLKGEDFAKKLNKAGYTTYAGDEWSRSNVYNYDRETPRSSKKLAKDLGFFEKRTVAEAKDIINQYSGGKHFLKNKNLTDAQITTRAAEYVAMEKNIEKTGGTYSFPRGKQNKRKVWQNIFASHAQGGRFKLSNADELPKFENGRINWRKDKAWRNAKFKDSKSGKIFTYGNLEEMVDKHGGGWKKAIKAYDDNARLNQTTFKGKALNEWFREGMIKKEYETLIEKKVPWKDKGLQKYLGEKKPYYSFTEAHHFKGVKDHPFDTESSFRYANRRQGNFQNSYDKAIKSGNPDRIAKAKIKYVEDMTKLSDDMGGIRYKMDDTRFVGQTGTPERIVATGAKEAGLLKNKDFVKFFKGTFQGLSPQSVLQMGRTHGCLKKDEGGSIMSCLQTKFEKNPEKFLQRSAPLAKGNPNLFKWFKNGRKIARGTGIALAWEAAFAPIVGGWAALEGESVPRIINEIAYGIPFIGETETEEWKRESGGDELAYTAKKIDELSQQEIPYLQQQLKDVINKTANVPGKGPQQRWIERDIEEKKLELQGYLNTPEFYEGPAGSYVDETVVGDAFSLADQTTAKIAADKAERKKEKFDWLKKYRIYAEPTWQSQASRAEGGIMNLKKK